jgi:hypothetical protein
MPRYFFHVRDRENLIEDQEGVELPDMEAARDQFQRAIRAVLDEEEWQDDVSFESELHVVDESGRTVLVTPFRICSPVLTA